MKISKILGCVLSLHLGVIALLLVQPGCQTGQPPTQTHTQTQTQTQDRTVRSNVIGASRTSGELIQATQQDETQGLDAAFNAGFDSDPMDSFEPMESFEPIESFEPVEPLESLSGGRSVPVEGPGYQSYTVKKGDSLWAIAKRYDVSVNELYEANGLNKNSVIRVGQQIQIPTVGGSAVVRVSTADTYQPSGFDQETTSYTVQRGDNLSKIANRFDTTVAALKAANGKSSDVIRVGETLTVPANGASANTSSAAPAPASTRSQSASSGGTQTHTVKAGEFPGKIARQYGMTTAELLSINNISDPRKLRVGQELTVSGSGSAENVDSRVETRVTSTPSTSTANVAPVPITPTRSVTTTTEPGTIRVIEADPIVEGELDDPDPDDIFEDAIEIPVIRMED